MAHDQLTAHKVAVWLSPTERQHLPAFRCGCGEIATAQDWRALAVAIGEHWGSVNG